MIEKSKHLAEYLFNPAIENLAIEKTLQATNTLKSNPNSKEAQEELNEMLDKVIAAVEASMFGPSPRLTDEENDLYMVLKRKKLVERHSGNYKWFDRVELDKEDETIYQRLEAKADGRISTKF